MPELSHRTFLAHGRAVHVMTKSTGVRASQTLSMQNSVTLRAFPDSGAAAGRGENIGMNQYHLKLPYPPSLNTYWRHARGRHYIAEKGTRYRQHITELIRQQNLDISTTSRIRISITANPPDKRQRDLDNLPKAVFDSLTHAGFWKDDSQIDDMRISRGERVSGGSLDVTIWEIGDET